MLGESVKTAVKQCTWAHRCELDTRLYLVHAMAYSQLVTWCKLCQLSSCDVYALFFLLLFMMSDVSTQKISFCKQHWGTLFDRTSI